MGMLTLPHQILSWIDDTSSRYLSLVLRPVRSPVRQTSGPLDASLHSPAATARSTSSADDRFVKVRLDERSRRRTVLEVGVVVDVGAAVGLIRGLQVEKKGWGGRVE